MPQVDLETLVSVCGGTDRKIACETLADDDDTPTEQAPEVAPDLPPESFWLSKDAEYDWFDRNAFFERKESTKGSSNSTNLNPNINPSSNSSSQRFSKAKIIGLPKTQKTNYVDSKRRNCKPSNIRLFPKRSESTGKSTVPLAEPSSPKVSCMGRVRSKRGRRRTSRREQVAVKSVAETAKSDGGRRKGFYSGLISLFRKDRRHRNKPAGKMSDPAEESSPRNSVSSRAREVSAVDPPSLGGMTRFVSGRRSESWGANDFEVIH